MKAKKGELKVITGNSAAAYGAMLCRPDVVASYPITPQTEVVEQLSKFHADGVLEAEMIEVEGENSAMKRGRGCDLGRWTGIYCHFLLGTGLHVRCRPAGRRVPRAGGNG